MPNNETVAEVLSGLFRTMRKQSDGRNNAHGERWEEGWRAAINFMESRVQRAIANAAPPAATAGGCAPEVTDSVLPLESATSAGLTCDDLLSDWVSGCIKPAEHGTYLRQFPVGEFDEDPEATEALSSWDGIGQWKMGDASDFFSNASPEQSAPWRGVCPRKLIAALTAALQEGKSHG